MLLLAGDESGVAGGGSRVAEGEVGASVRSVGEREVGWRDDGLLLPVGDRVLFTIERYTAAEAFSVSVTSDRFRRFANRSPMLSCSSAVLLATGHAPLLPMTRPLETTFQPIDSRYVARSWYVLIFSVRASASVVSETGVRIVRSTMVTVCES